MIYHGNLAFKMTASDYSYYTEEAFDSIGAKMIKRESNAIIERGAYPGFDLVRRMKLDMILTDRNITSLMHFTSLNALPYIVTDGLKPNCAVDDEYHMDKERSDRMTYCSCFSVSYPNGWVLGSYMERNPHITFVILEYDADIILDYPSYFIPLNAACQLSSAANRYRNWPQDLERLFTDSAYSSKGQILSRASLAGKPYLPTDQQSEVLIEGIIPSSRLKRIIVDSEVSKKKVLSALSKTNKTIQVDVDPRYFTQNRENSGIF